MIEFQHVHKTYRVAGREIPALNPTSLTIEDGQVFGLIGHSGAGQSTLLRLINRLEDSSGGKIIVDGEEVTALDANGLRRFRQQVGMIFQHFNLLASKTVADKFPDGKPLGRINDLAADGHGGAYYTQGGLFHARADGTVETAKELVIDETSKAGVAAVFTAP